MYIKDRIFLPWKPQKWVCFPTDVHQQPILLAAADADVSSEHEQNRGGRFQWHIVIYHFRSYRTEWWCFEIAHSGLRKAGLDRSIPQARLQNFSQPWIGCCALWLSNSGQTGRISQVRLGTEFSFAGVHPWNLCWEMSRFAKIHFLNTYWYSHHVSDTRRCGQSAVMNRGEVSVLHKHGRERKGYNRTKREGSGRKGGLHKLSLYAHVLEFVFFKAILVGWVSLWYLQRVNSN